VDYRQLNTEENMKKKKAREGFVPLRLSLSSTQPSRLKTINLKNNVYF
jgi:hypothetical protein